MSETEILAVRITLDLGKTDIDDYELEALRDGILKVIGGFIVIMRVKYPSLDYEET
jgi:hypothetical protein